MTLNENNKSNGDQEASKYGPQFMLQEHNRIIDAYHDLHLQKNELIKFYLAFVSWPVSIVAIFLTLFKYLGSSPQSASILQSLQPAAIGLSILLVVVGFAVMMVMLSIRGEQYLYVQTVNGTRQYFKEQHQIGAKYLVLPSDTQKIVFGGDDPVGRPFWESMIVNATTSSLIAFLASRLSSWFLGSGHPYCVVAVSSVMFVLSTAFFAALVRHELEKKLDDLKRNERARIEAAGRAGQPMA